jgi:hypothetical protein
MISSPGSASDCATSEHVARIDVAAAPPHALGDRASQRAVALRIPVREHVRRIAGDSCERRRELPERRGIDRRHALHERDPFAPERRRELAEHLRERSDLPRRKRHPPRHVRRPRRMGTRPGHPRTGPHPLLDQPVRHELPVRVHDGAPVDVQLLGKGPLGRQTRQFRQGTGQDRFAELFVDLLIDRHDALAIDRRHRPRPPRLAHIGLLRRRIGCAPGRLLRRGAETSARFGGLICGEAESQTVIFDSSSSS